MDTKEHEEFVNSTALYPNRHFDSGLIYAAVALAGEAGELSNVLKKILRGDPNIDELRERMIDELGDIQWYVTACAQELGVTLDEVWTRNIAKLRKRQAENKIKGSGDNR